MSFSKSGRYVAYGISKSGSDWSTIYFRETTKPFVTPAPDEKSANTGGPDRLSDALQYLKYGGVTWTHDDKGVFYKRFPAPKLRKRAESSVIEPQDDDSEPDHGTNTDLSQHAQLYYHHLGTSQDDDVLVVARDEAVATSMFSPEIST